MVTIILYLNERGDGKLDIVFNTVVMAGLLHDIGKFYQKGNTTFFDTSGRHPEVSAKFLKEFKEVFESVTDFDLLVELVTKHHENSLHFPSELLAQNASEEAKPYARMVSTADNLSSKERDEKAKEKQDYKTRPLASIFSSVKADDSIDVGTGHYKPAVFEPENCFPDCDMVKNIESRNAMFIEKLTGEFIALKKAGTKDFNTLFSIINSLFLKYLWCIPSSSLDEVPDVSLYDHLKTTCAISACLYRYHTISENMKVSSISNDSIEKFKIVLGDFSGIQKYIFEVSTTGAGGVAKRLRARSFYVNTLLEVVSHYICHSFGVPMENILISSGGKFYVLLPNIEGSDDMIERIGNEIEKVLFNESLAEISVNFAVMNLKGKDFKSFDDVLRELNERLNEKKLKKYESVLKNENGWDEESFILVDELSDKSLCTACKKAFIDKGDILCGKCSNDLKLGQALANARFVSFCKEKGDFKIFKDYYISVGRKAESGSYMVEMINSCTFPDYNHPFSIKYMANHIPVLDENSCDACDECEGIEPGQPLTFGCIAGNSTGRKLIGVLKADVDNLGFLFMEGLKRDGKTGRNTVSRITTFSRMLEMFFSGFINMMISEKYKCIYSVFSGGDDLFLLGPWDETVDMAIEISREFQRYTAFNPSFSISAAVVPEKPGYPISKCAKDAEQQLEKAKEYTNSKYNPTPKNQVSFLGECMKWDNFDFVIQQGKYIEEVVSTSVANTGQVRRLIWYNSLYKGFLKDKSTEKLKFIPMLTYDIKRNYQDKSHEKSRFKDWVLSMRKNIADNKALYYLNVIAEYGLMKIRG